MDGPLEQTTLIGQLLDQVRAGDGGAKDQLLSIASTRLRRLAHKMLQNFPGVARWEETDDILQNATLRLCRALRDLTPESPRSFFNLAAIQIRRELIDMARHHYGPHRLGANHESMGPTDSREHLGGEFVTPMSPEPGELLDWTEFHQQVEALPDDEREVFNLVWYHGLTQVEAARLIGVTERVIKWRWRAARLSLHRALQGESPE